MKDIEIAKKVPLQHILKIAAKLGIGEEHLETYGKFKAKVTLSPAKQVKKGKLILVTAVNPTPFGEGKTTVAIGLADGMAKIGKNVSLALREPSLGPVFGVKGGATGGGYAQVAPMEDINLHFTGDFHAITSANNLLSSLIDNHIKQGNELKLDLNRMEWRRCLDLNDRALRVVNVGLGGEINGVPRADGFNITAASEIMAILCLAEDLSDLKTRLGRIVVGYNQNGQEVLAKELNAQNAMAILLKDALNPNLVQTLEGTPAILHGGPFANIAHGCNSIRATRLSMALSDYTVTEAGFGADLGAEKFLNIKCRGASLAPDAVVLVATVRALKYNGTNTATENCQLSTVNPELQAGLVNLQGHLHNLVNVLGLKVVVAINRFANDTDEEIEIIKSCALKFGAKVHPVTVWANGGAGAVDLAKAVAELADADTQMFNLIYNDDMPLEAKINAVATKIYGANEVVFADVALEKIKNLNNSQYKKLPVCIAKTQYSFSQDPKLLGRPTGFTFNVKDVELRAGSGFIVVVAGDIMLMPGLSRLPAAVKMSISDEGDIEGIF